MRFEYPEAATPLDPNESEGLLLSLSTQAELNEFELLNITQAVAWAGRDPKVRKQLLSPETLRLLHQKMFEEVWRWAGTYRLTEKSIGVEPHRIGVELKNLCDDALVWLQHETYPPDELAARFHHRLVSIHPFPNGNGRHARLAADLLCRNQRWLLFTWGSANLVQPGKTRARYIAALQAADRGDFEPLVTFARS